MKIFINKEFNFKFIIIFFISICLFLNKWFFTFYIFGAEDVILKVINESESDGYYYFPLIKYLADGNLNLSFDPNIQELKSIPLPFGGIFFHSLFYKITSNFFYSIFLIEFISLYLFLLIFYLLFRTITNSNFALSLSLFIFIIPSLISLFSLDQLTYLNLLKTNIYSSRVPRPVVVNIYFFLLIYLFVKYEINIFLEKKLSIYFSILMGMLLTAFYYYFFIIFILTLLIILKNFDEIKKKFKQIKFLYLLSGVIVTIPFILNIFSHEPEFMERMGLIELDFERKKILILAYFKKFLDFKFLIVILLNTLLFLHVKKENKNNFYYTFYFLILASILAPILFVLISPKINIYYHFNNAIIIYNFLFFAFSIAFIFRKFIEKHLNRNLLTFIIIVVIFIFNLSNKHIFNSKNNERNETIEVINYLNQNNSIYKDKKILTFDPKIMVWLIINGYKNIQILNGNFTSKKNEMIESDLIFSLKVLNFDTDNFYEFISNQKSEWRYQNPNMQKFFFQRYLANSFKTYKNSNDFTDEEWKTIEKTSEFIVQQSIIPRFELQRLISKFNNFKIENQSKTSFPNIIILKKKKPYISFKENNDAYCLVFNNSIFEIYKEKNESDCLN